MWTKHIDFKEVVLKGWNEGMVRNGMMGIQDRIRGCRLSLLKWNRDVFGNVSKKLHEKSIILEDKVHNPYVDGALDCIQSLRKEVEALSEAEEMMWRQRSRISWLKEGDRNTNFFIIMPRPGKQRILLRVWRMRGDSGVL